MFMAFVVFQLGVHYLHMYLIGRGHTEKFHILGIFFGFEHNKIKVLQQTTFLTWGADIQVCKGILHINEHITLIPHFPFLLQTQAWMSSSHFGNV